MRSSVVRSALLLIAVLPPACRREPLPAPPLTAQVSGTIQIARLTAPVRIVRDRWGIPHVYAQSPADLFVAQGFVQAQDRLFQMDLWRRSVQGRLAEVLGANFIERDAMTRRVQYRGDLQREWASYGADARAIADAFVSGINAWVSLARHRPPEAFRLAGWVPELWSPDDLLNRTEAFDPNDAALEAIGRREMSEVVAEAVRRVGAPPFLTLLAAPVPADGVSDSPGDRELVSRLASVPAAASSARAVDSVLEVAEAQHRYEHPARRYLIHLHAPGWNVIGAASPWRPGVVIGHNERIAWGMTGTGARTGDVAEQPMNAASTRIVKEAIVVKGRTKPFEFESEFTPRGVVIASDRERGHVFVLDWRGFEAGTAPEMGALAINRAETAEDFDAAAARWQLPVCRFAVAGVNGETVDSGQQRDRQPASGTASGTAGATTGRIVQALFEHPLGVTAAARKRFNVGPLSRPESDQPLRARFTPRDWDGSLIINAPGQSESPDSPHFSDMAKRWSAGEMVPLVFSDAAVQASAESVLTLIPAVR